MQYNLHALNSLQPLQRDRIYIVLPIQNISYIGVKFKILSLSSLYPAMEIG